MKNIAIIPVRSGSQRIKDKNIKLVVNHPLMYYQIKCALNVPEIDKVVVATDNDLYSDYAKKFGAEVIIRPPEISHANSKSEDVLRYVITAMIDKGQFFDNIVFLQVTSPLNKPEYVSDALKLIEKEKANSVVTYVDFHGFLIGDNDILSRPMTQIKKPHKLETGCFWVTNTNAFMSTNNRICEPVSYLKLPKIASYEIDTEDELKIAEALLQTSVRAQDGYYYKKRDYRGDFENYHGMNEDPDGNIKDMLSEEIKNSKINTCKDEIDFINNIASDGTRRSILDLGCGIGVISSQFSDNYDKYGLEVSEDSVNYAKKYISNVHHGELEKNTYQDEFFDVIFSYHVIEHVPEPISFIKNICSIMKTNGHLIIGTPNFDCAMARRFGSKFRLLHDKTHVSLFSDFSLRDMLEDYGFQVDKIEYPFFNTEYFTHENLLRLDDTSKVSPPFYGNFMTIYARKK